MSNILPKERNTVPKYEDLILGLDYAFTINPADHHQYFNDPERLTKVVNYLKNRLNAHSFSYKLHIEVSPVGRLHGHGYINIQKKDDFYIHKISKLIESNTVMIKEQFTPEKDAKYQTWEQYINKQNLAIIKRDLPLCSERLIKTSINKYYNDD